MNLYRNFGNLLESWVTDGSQDLYLQTGPGLDRFDSISRDSVPLSNVKSESEDSGFETVSTSPCHSHQCSALTSEESQTVFGSIEDEVQPSSPSPSICSTSSSSVTLSSVAPDTTHLEVEQALRWSDSPSWKGPLHQIEKGTAGPRYRSNTASFPTSFQSNSSRTHHRFARPRRTRSQPSDPKKAELYRKCLKSHQHGQPTHSQLEQLADGDQYRLDKLSPGLLYLEQVCRMLENIAKLQQQNYSLQKEVEILKSQHAEIKCRSLHEEEICYPACQDLQILGLEDPPSESTQLKEPMGFRHRSVSDTHAAISHRRRTRLAQGQPIAGVLLEEPDGKDPVPENEHKKQSKLQKLKFTSFRRQETQLSDRESKSSQSKKKTRMPSFFSRNRSMTTRL